MILMLPEWEMRIFSILRSAGCYSIAQDSKSEVLTSVDDVVLVAVVQSATYLPRELARNPFS